MSAHSALFAVASMCLLVKIFGQDTQSLCHTVGQIIAANKLLDCMLSQVDSCKAGQGLQQVGSEQACTA